MKDSELATADDASLPRRRPHGEIGLPEARIWLRKYWLLVSALALLAGAAAWVHSTVFSTESFRATAIIAVVPPKFSSDLLPSTFTIQGYQELLESDAVLAETERRLIEAGTLRPAAHLNRVQVSSTIFVSRRSETSLAPMIRLAATARTADRSAAIVNTWAQVFLDRVENLMFGTTLSTIDVIEDLYPQTRDRLEEMEDRRVALALEFDRRQAALEIEGHRKVAEERSATARRLAVHEAETRRLTGRLRVDKEIVSHQEKLGLLRRELQTLEQELVTLGPRVVARERELHQLRQLLDRTEATTKLSRSVEPDILLSAAADEPKRGRLLDELSGVELVDEVQNPTHGQLALQASQAETDLSVLRPRSAELVQQIERISTEIAALEGTMAEDEAEVHRVVQQRSAELESLKQGRSAVEQAVHIERDRELAQVKRQRDLEIMQLDRQIRQQSALFEELAQEYNEALLAKSQSGIINLHLAAPGVPPQTPLARSALGKVAVATLLGALLGLVIATIRESNLQEPAP